MQNTNIKYGSKHNNNHILSYHVLTLPLINKIKDSCHFLMCPE